MRWCDIERNGRPVYHGPVWRWYRSGKLDGKEYYIFGDAAGVWPSYYENGHMSSLGAWDKGQKQGPWKYWNEAGWLKTEVTYSEEGNSRTDYYASGQRKAVGFFVRSGKIGKWTYWNQNGKEIADRDCERGVFSILGDECRLIADELDPKGYSLPISVGTKEGDTSAAVHVDSQVFKFKSPAEWFVDVDAGRKEQAPVVVYPKDRSWRAGPNRYVRVNFQRNRSFEQAIKDDEEDFEENVAAYKLESTKEGRLPVGFAYRLDSISYKPVIESDSPFSIVASNQVHEQIAYVNASSEVVLRVVVTTDSPEELQRSLPAFHSLLESLQ